MSDDEQDLKCTFCDTVLVDAKPVVLDCGHEACTKCLPVLRADGRPCPFSNDVTGGCRGVGLCEPSELFEQALVRKQHARKDTEAKILSAQLRQTILLDATARATAARVAKVHQSVAKEREEFLEKILDQSPSPHSLRPTLHVLSDVFYRGHEHRGLEILLGDEYGNEIGLHSLRLMLAKRLGIHKQHIEYDLANRSKYPIAADLEYAYKRIKEKVYRFTLATCELEVRALANCEWSAPDSITVSDAAGNCAVYHHDDRSYRSHIRVLRGDWELPNYKPNLKRRDKRLKCLENALVRKEEKIRAAGQAEQETLEREIKQLDCDIEALEMKIEFKEPQSNLVGYRAEEPPREVYIPCDRNARKLFVALERNFSARWANLAWPTMSGPGPTRVVPLTQEHALVLSGSWATLIDLKGDLLQGTAAPKKCSYTICQYTSITCVVARDKTMWIEYTSGEDETLKVKAYRMDTRKRVSDPFPDVLVGELPKRSTAVAPAVVADIAQIRSLLWLTPTVGNCIQVWGYTTY